jgi:hypothetical protein
MPDLHDYHHEDGSPLTVEDWTRLADDKTADPRDREFAAFAVRHLTSRARLEAKREAAIEEMHQEHVLWPDMDVDVPEE